MAGFWIQMRTNLWDDPRVSAMADNLDQGEATVIGGLYWLWAMADDHTEDGHLPDMTLKTIDRKTGIPGFGEALKEVGWITETDRGLEIPRFNEHNGESAKKRALTAKRVASHRTRKPQCNAPSVTKALQVRYESVTGALPKAETETEKIKEPPQKPPKGGGSDSPKVSADLEIPESLDTPRVREELDAWLEHRRQIRKPYKSALNLNQHIAKYAPRGPDALVDALQHSRENEYQGIFDPKGVNSSERTNPAMY